MSSKILVTQSFSGAAQTSHRHGVTSVAGLRRVLETYSIGNGWGLDVQVPRSLADRLGIYEMQGGGLGCAGEPLVEGKILEGV